MTSDRLLTSTLTGQLLARAEPVPPEIAPGLGWRRSDALCVVEQLEAAGVMILGGDVWSFDTAGKLRPAYASWHYNPDPGHDVAAEAREAARVARSYIDAYPHDDRPSPLFSFVCREKNSGRQRGQRTRQIHLSRPVKSS